MSAGSGSRSTNSKGSKGSSLSKHSKRGMLDKFFGFKTDVEPINEEDEDATDTESESEESDGDIARENSRPQSTRTRIVVNMVDNTGGLKKGNKDIHFVKYNIDEYDKVRMQLLFENEILFRNFEET